MLALLSLGLTQCVSRLPGVSSQATDAVCVDDYSWMSNSKGQSPCLVGAYLKAPCDGLNNAFVYSLRSPEAYYTGPVEQNACKCNTVFYSLSQACERCQFPPNISLYMDPWPAFAQNCTSVTISEYPVTIPADTAIPIWARQNVTVHNIFNVSLAQWAAAADIPDITAPPNTSWPQPSSSATTAADATVSQQPSDVGAIVGGAVGGFLGMLLIGTMVLWMLLRQRSLRRHPHRQMSERSAFVLDGDSDTAYGYGHQPAPVLPTSTSTSSPMSLPSPATKFYDPNDPRTFPQDPPPPPFRIVSRAASMPPPVSKAAHARHPSVSGKYAPLTPAFVGPPL